MGVDYEDYYGCDSGSIPDAMEDEARECERREREEEMEYKFYCDDLFGQPPPLKEVAACKSEKHR